MQKTMPKSVLIIGGSRGIGAETARTFAAAGYNVLATYNQTKPTANRQPPITNHQKCNIRSRADTDKTAAAAVKLFGKIDTLVVSAGVSAYGLITDFAPGQVTEILDVNLKGAIFAAQSVIPYMVPQKSGNIIFISSIWGLVGASCEAVYSAAKAGVIGLTKSLAKELGPSNIRVNCIAPGVIATDMNANLSAETLAALKAETPLGRLGASADVAKCALYLAEADFVTGQVISPNGGLVI